jgi:hypothetical protein
VGDGEASGGTGPYRAAQAGRAFARFANLGTGGRQATWLLTAPERSSTSPPQVDGPVCIVRATDGKRKVACAVSAGDHVRFHMDIFTVIKASTEALKKPKRAKRVKSTA